MIYGYTFSIYGLYLGNSAGSQIAFLDFYKTANSIFDTLILRSKNIYEYKSLFNIKTILLLVIFLVLIINQFSIYSIIYIFLIYVMSLVCLITIRDQNYKIYLDHKRYSKLIKHGLKYLLIYRKKQGLLVISTILTSFIISSIYISNIPENLKFGLRIIDFVCFIFGYYSISLIASNKIKDIEKYFLLFVIISSTILLLYYQHLLLIFLLASRVLSMLFCSILAKFKMDEIIIYNQIIVTIGYILFLKISDHILGLKYLIIIDYISVFYMAICLVKRHKVMNE